MTVLAVGWWAEHGSHTLSLLGPILLLTLLALGSEARAWWQRRVGRPVPSDPPTPLRDFPRG